MEAHCSFGVLHLLFVVLRLVAASPAIRPHSPPLVNWQQRNLRTIERIYNQTIYPNNLAFIQMGAASVPSGLFNENATGRITPIGNFSGFQDSVEYFFGLTPPIQKPLYDTWTRAKIVEFTSGCPEVASSVVYGETSVVNTNSTDYGRYITSIKQVAFWRFDNAGAVLNYDAWLPNLNDYTRLLYGIAPSPPANAAQIQTLCERAQQLCTGSNTQYSSAACCVKELSRKPFGEWDELWGDNVLCRTLHVLLARLRPDVHCSHVGPSGGGKCIDVDYNSVYLDDQALFGAPVGETFTCPS